jgi:hypothetical protein
MASISCRASECDVPLRTNWRWQLAFSVGALDTIRWQATRPLKLNFLGNGRYGGTYLVDYFFQFISVYVEPLGPGAHLTGVCQINLIANWLVFDSSHCNFPWMRFNGVSTSSFRAFVQYAAPTAAPGGASDTGQKAQYSLRANVVRCCPENRHTATTAPCPFGAITGLMRCNIIGDTLISSSGLGGAVHSIIHGHACARCGSSNGAEKAPRPSRDRAVTLRPDQGEGGRTIV